MSQILGSAGNILYESFVRLFRWLSWPHFVSIRTARDSFTRDHDDEIGRLSIVIQAFTGHGPLSRRPDVGQLLLGPLQPTKEPYPDVAAKAMVVSHGRFIMLEAQSQTAK